MFAFPLLFAFVGVQLTPREPTGPVFGAFLGFFAFIVGLVVLRQTLVRKSQAVIVKIEGGTTHLKIPRPEGLKSAWSEAPEAPPTADVAS